MYIVSIIFASELVIAVLSAATLKIHVGTWNVDSNEPMDGIEELLGTCSTGSDPDLILLGFQEIVSPDIKGALKKSFEGENWSDYLETELTKQNYKKVKAETMFGIASYVYLKQNHEKSLNPSSVKVEEAKTGIMKGIGNKGGLVTSFELYGKGFTVITSHLPAHYEQNAKRISAYKKVFDLTKELKNDYMFWYGDLNFRVEQDDSVIRSSIQNNNHVGLLEYDQLKMCQKNGSVFKDWQEMDITFKPTFKYAKDSKDYSPKRRPSWTDRILYKSNTKQSIQPKKYNRLEYDYSDHKPVIAEFSIEV